MNNLIRIFLLGLLTAILFSAFIYFEHYSLTNKLINTLFGFFSIALLLYIPKKSILVAGFFIGLLWFYWIGYSFEYQGVGYMTPIITLAFAVIYLLFFAPLALTNKPYIRAILLFMLSYFEPFDWNWLQIELLFVESYIGIYKYQLFVLLLALALPSLLAKKYKFAPLLLLLFAINYGYKTPREMPLDIKLIQTNIAQEKKWRKENLAQTLSMIYAHIDTAISEKRDIILFPESVFPLFLNKHPHLIDKLLTYSQKITIVAGSLLLENHQHYNVTYMFEKGKYQVAKKLILVPFGEYIPLPKFAREYINKTFFSGASDFITANKPTDFIINGIKFRNAICYEATCQEIYEGDVSYVLASSNNAWFAPSIEPTLQNLLLKYYARKNGVTIYHSANYKGSGVIR